MANPLTAMAGVDHLGRPIKQKKVIQAPRPATPVTVIEDKADKSPLPTGCSMIFILPSQTFEFFYTAFELGMLFYLILIAFVAWYALEQLYEMLTAPRPLPPYFPPAPPPPPLAPDPVAIAGREIQRFAEEEPISYLVLDYSVAFVIGLMVLFMKDINDWFEARRTAARQAEGKKGYQKLPENVEDIETALGPAILQVEAKTEAVLSRAELTKELLLVTDKVEELQIKTRVLKRGSNPTANGFGEELEQLVERRNELQRLVSGKEKAKEAANREGGEVEEGAMVVEGPSKKRGGIGAAAANQLA